MKNTAYKFLCGCMLALLYSMGVNAQPPGAKIVAPKIVGSTDDAEFSFFNVSQGATHYRWLTGDGATIDSDNLNWEYSDVGYYKVSLIAYKDEKADTSSVHITVLRGANYGNPLIDVTAAPNPATLSENTDCDN